ncbi:hypothetical protein EIP86_003761 [Pleurotus ostreatoroseus]|nr:hypothetical protein EIP86_003761 [Pleurotus ostreatoroseus]
MSDLKLVYRCLRKISEWTLSFYSEVYVTGKHNVPEGGPVLLPVCFWAKATLFRNLVARNVLLSSGSIPVRRSVDIDSSTNAAQTKAGVATTGRNDKSSDAHLSLFRETFQALDAGEVIGLFPEGTSYTEPEIAQIKDGAAWVALEYARWRLKREDTSGQAEPSKSRKLVRVEFGEPINLDAYTQSFLSATDTEDSRSVVRSLTGEIERRLRALTINAPNWYIDRLVASPKPSALPTLVDYYALLQRTGLTHHILASVLPSRSGTLANDPTRLTAIFLFLRHFLMTILHPSTLLFLPPLLIHLPGYITAALGDRFLVTPGEEEGRTQARAVCGGLGYGLVAAGVGQKVARKMGQWCASSAYVEKMVSSMPLGVYLVSVLSGRVGRMVGTNYNRFIRLRAAWTIFLGILAPASCNVSETDLGPYMRPILPAPNPYIKRNRKPVSETGVVPSANGDSKPETSSLMPSSGPTDQPRVASWRLIRPLLRAREEAEKVVNELGLMK